MFFSTHSWITGTWDSAWQVLLILKDIFELVVAPVHTVESIAYLDLSEHHHKFLEIFPEEGLTPKHHFLEHYPALIERFRPLVGVWTMHFEAKHQFFSEGCKAHQQFQKCAVNTFSKTSDDDGIPHACRCETTCLMCCKNIIKAIRCAAFRHKSCFKRNITNLVKCAPSQNCHLLWKKVYCWDDCVLWLYWWTSVQIVILDNCVRFIVKIFTAWYEEHLRSFQLEDTGKLTLL